MNPIYQAWVRSKDAEVRYDFLRKLYGAYDGMLEQAIKDLKKEKKRKCNENKGIIAGIGTILRGLLMLVGEEIARLEQQLKALKKG